MPFINTGAYVNGTRPKSKKALKDAMKASPQNVTLDVTSAFHNGPTVFTGDSLPSGYTLSVCGPDPYNDRKWYANVTDKGKVS